MEETRARQKIEALIDQPGDSFRDECDALDLDRLQHASLATIAPPRYGPPDDSWMMVDSAETMQQCAFELAKAQPSFIAFDLEAFNQSKYAQLTCLLQIATDALDKIYVIDTLAPGVWEKVSELAPLFGDPSIVKIGHSIAGLDIRSLHRDFGIFVVNAFDTYEAAHVLRLPSQGLAAVCEYYGMRDSETYKSLKQIYQTCDWTVRPLTQPMLQYARYDVHFLIPLRELMVRDLTRDAWGSPQSEALLVANALSEMLKQYRQEDEDDGERKLDELHPDIDQEDDRPSAPDSTPLLQSDGVMRPADQESDGSKDDYGDDNDDNDNRSFLTTKEFRDGDDGSSSTFYTPFSSFSADDCEVPGVSSPKKVQPCENSGMDAEPLSKLDVPTLRMQVPLMRTVSLCHQRCLQFWKSNPEPHMQNMHLTSLIHRARRREVNFTVSRTQLYSSLVDWRNQVADEMECLPAFVASLDFLLSLALKRPQNDAGLRRISFHLPPFLEEHRSYRKEVFSVIRASFEEEEKDGEPVDRAPHLYSSFGSISVAPVEESSDADDRIRNTEDLNQSHSEFVWALCIVGAVIAGGAIAILAARRRTK